MRFKVFSLVERYAYRLVDVPGSGWRGQCLDEQTVHSTEYAKIISLYNVGDTCVEQAEMEMAAGVSNRYDSARCSPTSSLHFLEQSDASLLTS